MTTHGDFPIRYNRETRTLDFPGGLDFLSAGCGTTPDCVYQIVNGQYQLIQSRCRGVGCGCPESPQYVPSTPESVGLVESDTVSCLCAQSGFHALDLTLRELARARQRLRVFKIGLGLAVTAAAALAGGLAWSLLR